MRQQFSFHGAKILVITSNNQITYDFCVIPYLPVLKYQIVLHCSASRTLNDESLNYLIQFSWSGEDRMRMGLSFCGIFVLILPFPSFSHAILLPKRCHKHCQWQLGIIASQYMLLLVNFDSESNSTKIWQKIAQVSVQLKFVP